MAMKQGSLSLGLPYGEPGAEVGVIDLIPEDWFQSVHVDSTLSTCLVRLSPVVLSAHSWRLPPHALPLTMMHRLALFALR
jgi:hypothetical protein